MRHIVVLGGVTLPLWRDQMPDTAEWSSIYWQLM